MTTRRGEGRIRYDYEFVTKTSMFYLERLSFDEFQDLDLRAEEQAGVNRRLMDRNRLGLSADAGVARVDSFYEEAEDEGDFGLILGGHAFWTIVGSLKLTQDVEYRPAFADFDRYLLSSETGLSTKLSENWQVRLLYQIHYSSQPPEDVEQTDRNLALTLGYSF
jgi:putative salt-induced outer membrane protein YdiY